MTDIKTIDTFVISNFVNCIREYFLRNNFYEVTLYDTTKYSVTNTSQIKTETGDLLRYNTEPEIWQMGVDYDKFFCITSLFRNEDLSSLLHKNEFKVVDFYIKNSNETKIFSIFYELLKYLEEHLYLPILSGLRLHPCDFEDFKNNNVTSKGNSIYKVENYPIEESFYDAIDDATGKSKKGELFFLGDKNVIEFSVFGQVDENKNPLNVVEKFNLTEPNIKSLNLFGMCLGIERTILCYEAMKY